MRACERTAHSPTPITASASTSTTTAVTGSTVEAPIISTSSSAPREVGPHRLEPASLAGLGLPAGAVPSLREHPVVPAESPDRDRENEHEDHEPNDRRDPPDGAGH